MSLRVHSLRRKKILVYVGDTIKTSQKPDVGKRLEKGISRVLQLGLLE